AHADLLLAVELRLDRFPPGDAGLQELPDSRQPLGDVHPGDTTGVERTHGELSAWLADRLGSDDTHRLANLDQLAGRQVAAVAEPADAFTRLAGENGAHLDLGDT